VFFSLLKGHLFSDGIGLVSHWFLWCLIGIYGRSRGSGGFRRVFVLADLGGILMGVLEVVGMFLMGFFWVSDRVLMGSQWNALRALPTASLWLDSCVKWFAVVGTYRTLNSR
jgi:hypothetical protein